MSQERERHCKLEQKRKRSKGRLRHKALKEKAGLIDRYGGIDRIREAMSRLQSGSSIQYDQEPTKACSFKAGELEPRGQSNRRRDEAPTPTCGLVPEGRYILVALRRWWWPENISSGSEQADLAKDPSLTEAGDVKVKQSERREGRKVEHDCQSKRPSSQFF